MAAFGLREIKGLPANKPHYREQSREAHAIKAVQYSPVPSEYLPEIFNAGLALEPRSVKVAGNGQRSAQNPDNQSIA